MNPPDSPKVKPPPLPPRDLTKTLPGTGVTPLVDGDLVAGVIRDLAIGVQRLENGMHQRFDALEPAPTETIPPPSKGQKAAAGAVNLGKYAGLFVVAAVVARVLEHKYPGAADAIEAVLKALNL